MPENEQPILRCCMADHPEHGATVRLLIVSYKNIHTKKSK